jgi:hypothetical protein
LAKSDFCGIFRCIPRKSCFSATPQKAFWIQRGIYSNFIGVIETWIFNIFSFENETEKGTFFRRKHLKGCLTDRQTSLKHHWSNAYLFYNFHSFLSFGIYESSNKLSASNTEN